MNPPLQIYNDGSASNGYAETETDWQAPEQWSIPRPTVGQALLRNWLLVVLPAIVFAGVGAALALSRPPTYTAEARLSVGKADPTSPAFGGFVTAAAGLAAVYSRAVSAPGVVGPVSRQLSWSQGLVASRLTATPVQDSPIIRVIGTGPSAGSAEAVANAAAARLITYVTETNRSNPDGTRLLGLYHQVALEKAQTDASVAAANNRLALDPENGSLKSLVLQETASSEALGLHLNGLSGAYLQAEASQAGTDVLAPLGTATSAGNDRGSKVQTMAGVGLLAGLVIGVALAMWRANELMRRRLAA